MISLRNPKILEHFAGHLRGEGFTEIKTSKLIGTGTKGGTGLFSVDYFDTMVFLAQSPQFYKQAMVASGLERVLRPMMFAGQVNFGPPAALGLTQADQQHILAAKR